MTIPSDFQSETFLLARMLTSINASNEALEALTPEDFSEPRHQAIFSAMGLLYGQDAVIEPSSVAACLLTNFSGQADTAYLFGLHTFQYGDYDEVKVFIKNIKEASRLKKFIYIGREITAQASEGKRNSEQIQVDSLAKIEELFSDGYDKGSFTIQELLQKDFAESGKDFLSFTEQQMENHRKGINTLRGIPTGFPKRDEYLSGFCKGHFIVVGARPGAGKTTFILNLIHRMTRRGLSIGFFSLEMTAEEAQQKLLCIDSGLNSESVTRGSINHQEYQDLVVSVNNLKSSKILIDEQPCLKISQVVSRAKRMVIAHGIQILFIDYLGEIKGDGKFTNKQEEIQAVSKGLRALAKKLKIPVVCIAQLNRENEKETRAPRKSDLRESGQIEADAHSIILLHKPSTDGQFDEPGMVKAYIVKNRFGREGCINFHFEGDKGRFSEIDYTNLTPVEE